MCTSVGKIAHMIAFRKCDIEKKVFSYTSRKGTAIQILELNRSKDAIAELVPVRLSMAVSEYSIPPLLNIVRGQLRIQ